MPLDVLTARVPELPAQDLPLHIDDKIILWQSQNNKTVQRKLSDLRAYILVGESGSTPPVSTGNSIIVKPTAIEAGTQIMPVPSLAGLQFIIRREGIGILEPSEYNILSAGGFELTTPGDTLEEDEVFEIEPFTIDPIGGGPIVPGTSNNKLITGVKVISANTILNNTTDMGKLLQIRAASTLVVVTLPSITDIPVNQIIYIETNLDNTVPAQISTSGGQFIYFNNTSKTAVFMGEGESLVLYRGEDGFYVINDFGINYRMVGRIEQVFKRGLNQVVCNGQLLPRASYPRLWEYAQTLGGSFVTDAVWNVTDAVHAGRTVLRPNRGCFSNGNGSTTFRVPDLMGVFLRSVISESGSDPERFLNKPGGYQDMTLQDHWHEVGTEPGNNTAYKRSESVNVRNWNTGNTDVAIKDATTSLIAPTSASIGEETRPENVGILYVVNY